MEKIIVQNLKCGGCAKSITNKLSELDCVQHVDVDVDLSLVLVNLVELNQLNVVKQKLAEMGYPEENEDNPFRLKAKLYMSCAVGKMSN
jgi:copper chaperone